MPIGASGPISLLDIKNEFGGSATNISLGEYLRDPHGPVSGNNTNVPSSAGTPETSFSDFYSTHFKVKVDWTVIAGGGGGGSGTYSSGGSGNAPSGSNSSLVPDGSSGDISTITATGGTGGLNGWGPGWSGTTAGEASPLTSGGGGSAGNISSGAGGNASAAGAGGGGGAGRNGAWYESDGRAGKGGEAGAMITGNAYSPPQTLTMNVGAGGAGHDGHADGGDGYQGYVKVEVRHWNDGINNYDTTEAIRVAVGSQDVIIATGPEYTG